MSKKESEPKISYIVRRVHIGTSQQLQELSHECGELYSKTLVFFWRTVRHKGIWLKPKLLMRLFTSPKLHAHTLMRVCKHSLPPLPPGGNSAKRTRARSRRVAVGGTFALSISVQLCPSKRACSGFPMAVGMRPFCCPGPGTCPEPSSFAGRGASTKPLPRMLSAHRSCRKMRRRSQSIKRVEQNRAQALISVRYTRPFRMMD